MYVVFEISRKKEYFFGVYSSMDVFWNSVLENPNLHEFKNFAVYTTEIDKHFLRKRVFTKMVNLTTV